MFYRTTKQRNLLKNLVVDPTDYAPIGHTNPSGFIPFVSVPVLTPTTIRNVVKALRKNEEYVDVHFENTVLTSDICRINVIPLQIASVFMFGGKLQRENLIQIDSCTSYFKRDTLYNTWRLAHSRLIDYESNEVLEFWRTMQGFLLDEKIGVAAFTKGTNRFLCRVRVDFFFNELHQAIDAKNVFVSHNNPTIVVRHGSLSIDKKVVLSNAISDRRSMYGHLSNNSYLLGNLQQLGANVRNKRNNLREIQRKGGIISDFRLIYNRYPSFFFNFLDHISNREKSIIRNRFFVTPLPDNTGTVRIYQDNEERYFTIAERKEPKYLKQSGFYQSCSCCKHDTFNYSQILLYEHNAALEWNSQRVTFADFAEPVFYPIIRKFTFYPTRPVGGTEEPVLDLSFYTNPERIATLPDDVLNLLKINKRLFQRLNDPSHPQHQQQQKIKLPTITQAQSTIFESPRTYFKFNEKGISYEDTLRRFEKGAVIVGHNLSKIYKSEKHQSSEESVRSPEKLTVSEWDILTKQIVPTFAVRTRAWDTRKSRREQTLFDYDVLCAPCTELLRYLFIMLNITREQSHPDFVANNYRRIGSSVTALEMLPSKYFRKMLSFLTPNNSNTLYAFGAGERVGHNERLIKDYSDNPLTYGTFSRSSKERLELKNIYTTKSLELGAGQKINLHKTDPIDTTCYLGVELEVTAHPKAFDYARYLYTKTLAEYHNEFKPTDDHIKELGVLVATALCDRYFVNNNRSAIIKSDSTCSNIGFEIVSVPGTHAWHLNEGWKGFFKEDFEDQTSEDALAAPSTWLQGWVNNGGARKTPWDKEQFWQAPTCGIHVHVSRDALTPIQLGKIQVFVNSNQNKFIESVAGRGPNQWSNFLTKKIKDGVLLNRTGTGIYASNLTSCGRYEAVNVVGDKRTIEFRLFRSNVSKAGFFKCLDFVQAVVDWTRDESMKSLTNANFIAFVMENRGRYPWFSKWLIDTKHAKDALNRKSNARYMPMFEEIAVAD